MSTYLTVVVHDVDPKWASLTPIDTQDENGVKMAIIEAVSKGRFWIIESGQEEE